MTTETLTLESENTIRASHKTRLARSNLIQVRDELQRIIRQDGWTDRIESPIGAVQCAIQSLYYVIEEMERCEIEGDNMRLGKSIPFRSRGIGLDNCPGCFICGGEEKLYYNIAAFVESKEDGETIVAWFKQGARLDFRPSEPNWIQVKIGACEDHLEALKALSGRTEAYRVLRLVDIERVKS